MKKGFYFLTVISVFVLGAFAANAQEADPEVQEESPVVHQASEEIPNPNEIGALEGKSSAAVAKPEAVSKTVVSTTSAQNKPKQEKSTDKDEDDALSFNFLYYIIQKFKISDLKNN